jgi:hypothetical protein
MYSLSFAALLDHKNLGEYHHTRVSYYITLRADTKVSGITTCQYRPA